ncbi:MAG: protein kinase, partial [Planctomycetes bacterium]|nr:protein kinase [Planctomycetota bacterium]
MAPGSRQRKHEREDALFRQILAEKGHLTEDVLRRAVRERARLAGRGAELTLYQVLLKMRLLDLPKVKEIFAEIQGRFAFCDACGQEVPLDAPGGLRCPACGAPVDPGQTRAITPPPGVERPSRRLAREGASEDRLLGELLGKCRIEAKVGAGGMGVVYRARHIALDRTVAVKVLLPQMAGNEEAYRRFVREARTMAKIRHPNVITVYDVLSEQGFDAIVMEYCEGHDLGRILREEGPLAAPRALEYMRQVARGLGALHAAGIVHRDMKPENLMLDENGAVRVMDFSLARSVQTDRDLTLSEQILGTPYYMSPEQGTGKRLDQRSDIYSLGATFYQIVTGERPFGGDSPVDIIMKHLFDEPVPPHRLRREVPVRLSRVLLKAMAKKPADRYESCAALETDLARVARGEAPLAAPFLSPALLRRAVRSALAAASLALVLAGSFWWAISRGTGETATEHAQDVRGPERAAPPIAPPADPSIDLYEAALEYLGRHENDPKDYEEAIDYFERVVAKYPGSKGAELALGKIEEVRTKLAREAMGWWADREPLFESALAEDRFGDAATLLADFPAWFGPTQVARTVESALSRVEEKRLEFQEALAAEMGRVEAAAKLAESMGDLVEAIRALDSFGVRFVRTSEAATLAGERERLSAEAANRWTIVEGEFVAALEAGKLDDARDAFTKLQKVAVGDSLLRLAELDLSLRQAEERKRLTQLWSELEGRFGDVKNKLQGWKFDEARSLLDELAALPRYAEFSDQIARETRTVARAFRVVEAARGAVADLQGQKKTHTFKVRSEGKNEIQAIEARVLAWNPRGEPDRLRVEIYPAKGEDRVSRPGEISLLDLTVESLLDLAKKSLDPRDGETRLALAAYCLAQDRYEDAEKWLESLGLEHGRATPGLELEKGRATPDDEGDAVAYREKVEDFRFRELLERSRKSREDARWVEAWKSLQEALRLRPEDPLARADFALL